MTPIRKAPAAGLAHGLAVRIGRAEDDRYASHAFGADQPNLKRRAVGKHCQCGDEAAFDEEHVFDGFAGAMQTLAERVLNVVHFAHNQLELVGGERRENSISNIHLKSVRHT